MFKNKAFITTTLPYLSGSGAHVGHAFEFVLADVLSRYWRYKLGGSNVFFNTGVDEHGQKIYQAAQLLGQETQVYCDSMAEQWKKFCEMFFISYDNFYRTTDIKHKTKSVEYFKSLIANNKVYLNKYSGLYCQGCEAFKTDKEIMDGKCPDHLTLELKKVEEENYFLILKQLIKEDCVPNNILVNGRIQNELNNFINNAEDISVSRENAQWSIPIPDTNQSIYIWTEALCNYFFAAGYKPGEPLTEEFKEWWENALIICGPDNLRFQAMILPALLAAGNLPVTHKVMVHGSIQDIEGKKMSKSTGNGIDPVEQVEKYGINAVRYYLCVGLNTFDNSNYLEADLINKWNNDIVKGYGNLMARVLHLIDIKNVSIENENILLDHKFHINIISEDIDGNLKYGKVKQAFTDLNALVSYGDKLVSDARPYSLECPNPEEILNTLYYLLHVISPYFIILFPNMDYEITDALKNKKKVILFKPIEHAEQVI